MKLELYDRMYKVESYHWWFTGKKEIVLSLLDKLASDKRQPIKLADFGCGCGLMLSELSRYGYATGIDFSPLAIQYCRKTFDGELIQADLNEALDIEGLYDIGIALDIVEHVQNDHQAIRNICNSLKGGGGILIMTVPAFQWLWSQNDINNMHCRRYHKRQLARLLQSENFSIKYISYYNFYLFLPAAIVRIINKAIRFDGDNSIEMGIKDSCINGILRKIFSSERRVICRNGHFPFGLSLIAVAKKKRTD